MGCVPPLPSHLNNAGTRRDPPRSWLKARGRSKGEGLGLACHEEAEQGETRSLPTVGQGAEGAYFLRAGGALAEACQEL